MSGILADLFAPLIGLLIGGAMVVLSRWEVGRQKRKRKDAEDKADALQDDLETAKRIDRVRSLDAAAARERLRNRKPSGDL